MIMIKGRAFRAGNGHGASVGRFQRLKGLGLPLRGSGLMLSRVWLKNPPMRSGRRWMSCSRLRVIAAKRAAAQSARLPRPFLVFRQTPRIRRWFL